MKKYITALLLVCLGLTHKQAIGQARYDYFDMPVRVNTGQPLLYFYKDVTVLDNRCDTSSIYLKEDGNEKGPKITTFQGNTALAIAKYFSQRTARLEKSNQQLLINLLVFKVPNKTFIRKLNKDSVPDWEICRQYLYIAADFYAGEQGTYKRIFRLQKRYAYTIVKETVREALDDMVELAEQFAVDAANKKGPVTAVYKRLVQDTFRLKIYNDSPEKTIEDINVSARQRWMDHDVFNRTAGGGPVIFPLFDDFRKDAAKKAAFSISLNPFDSTYELKVDSSLKIRKPWAVADSSGFYIRLFKTNYLKLTKQHGAFVFHVPSTLPDMYHALSAEYVKAQKDYPSTYLGEQPTTILLDGIIDGIIYATRLISRQKKLNKIEAAEYGPNYRDCVVDLETGDILY